jgi:hypothetical protein
MTEEAPPSRRVSVHLALALALFAIGSMEWKGYRFGGSNQSLQVPLLKHLADPSLYTRDAVLTSFEGYSSFFFQALAPAVRVTGVEPLYFALYLLLHMAALAALFGLARRLFASTAAGVIACVLYVAAVPSLGAEFTYWPRLTHAHAATALLLGALYFYVAGRTRLAFVLCGLAFDIHALYAAYVGAMHGAWPVMRPCCCSSPLPRCSGSCAATTWWRRRSGRRGLRSCASARPRTRFRRWCRRTSSAGTPS